MCSKRWLMPVRPRGASQGHAAVGAATLEPLQRETAAAAAPDRWPLGGGVAAVAGGELALLQTRHALLQRLEAGSEARQVRSRAAHDWPRVPQRRPALKFPAPRPRRAIARRFVLS